MAIKPLFEVDQPSLAKRPRIVNDGAATSVRHIKTGEAITNVILLALPEHEFGLLQPHLQFVELPQQLVLHEPGQKVEFGYFPNSGMTSLVVQVSTGRNCEVGIVGKEGMVSACLAMDICQAPYRAVMQIPGDGFRVKGDALMAVLAEAPELKKELLRYVFLQGFQVAQIAACNRLHEIEQRLARWLLMCQDRVGSEVLFLTHEFLADMLGTGRPSVTLAAGALQRAGTIENLRGAVKIIDRKKLEESACECYAVIHNFNGGLGLE
jgi:CRP-like cAMP-binding protein